MVGGGGSDNGSGATGSGADGSGAGDSGGSGGQSTGGAAIGGTGATAAGEDAMGGVGSDGGSGGDDGSTTEEREFVRCFPWAYAHPEEGPLLAATPTGTVLLVGPSAPADLFPGEVSVPFLVELSTSGETVRGMTFPDASGPQIITVSNEGFIFLAGQDRFDTRFGEFELPDFADGAYYLVKLSPQLEILAATMVEAAATQVNALHVDANGDLIVGTAAADFEAGSMHPRRNEGIWGYPGRNVVHGLPTRDHAGPQHEHHDAAGRPSRGCGVLFTRAVDR